MSEPFPDRAGAAGPVQAGLSAAGAHGLVRIFVRNLRRKLSEDATNPAWIFNERGVGYRMAEPAGQ